MIGGLALAVAAAPTTAGEIEQAEVSFRDGRYSVTAVLKLDAPAEAVRGVATDHDRLYRLSDTFAESKLLERYDAQHAKRRIRVHTCVLIFCFDFVMTERVEELDNGDIVTTIIPEESDFREGWSRWEIRPSGPATTILRFETHRAPDFWIPPLIGPWIVKQKVRKELLESILRIEDLAAEHHAGPP